MNKELTLFLHKILLVLVIAVVAVVAWQFTQLILTLFAGVLLAILWRGVARWLSERTSVRYSITLPLVILLHLGIMVLFGFIAVPKLSEGIRQIAAEAPRIAQQVEDQLNGTTVGKELLNMLQQKDLSASVMKWSELLSALSTALGVLVDTLLILVFAAFFISNPRLYVEGILHLVPKANRARSREVIECLDNTLFRWFIGKIVDMLSIFIMTIIGLWLLDMPLIFTFALIAFFLSFVPNIGPIVSAVPPIAFALLESPSKALYVGLLYLGIQLTESYFITPAVQKKASFVPPVLLLFVQFLMGKFTGVLGLLLATPLLVMIMVTVKMLYIEDSLGDHSLYTCKEDSDTPDAAT